VTTRLKKLFYPPASSLSIHGPLRGRHLGSKCEIAGKPPGNSGGTDREGEKPPHRAPRPALAPPIGKRERPSRGAPRSSTGNTGSSDSPSGAPIPGERRQSRCLRPPIPRRRESASPAEHEYRRRNRAPASRAGRPGRPSCFAHWARRDHRTRPEYLLPVLAERRRAGRAKPPSGRPCECYGSHPAFCPGFSIPG
jgi:hypothetical protein